MQLLDALARSGTRAQVVDRLLDEHGGAQVDNGLGELTSTQERER